MKQKIKVFRTDGHFLEEVLNTIGYKNILGIIPEPCCDSAIINVIYKDIPKTRKQVKDLDK